MQNVVKILSLFLLMFLFWGCAGGGEKTSSEEIAIQTEPNIPEEEYARAEGDAEEYSDEQALRKKVAKSSDDATNEQEIPITEVQNTDTESGEKEIKIDQKIIKNAEVRFQVKNLEQSALSIQKSLQKRDAYVSSARQTRQYGSIESEIVIRVKSNEFEELLNELLKQSVFLDYKNVSAQDVTEEFVDIQSRLKTKRAVENRYLEILQKAQTINEILQVEEKLRYIREEIESKEGRLKFLKNRVAYSTITLRIFEQVEGEPVAEIGFFTKLGKGFARGWHNLLEFIIGLSYGWPVLLILGTALFFFVRFIRRMLKKYGKTQKNTTNSNE